MRGATMAWTFGLTILSLVTLGCGGRSPDQEREDRTILLQIHMGWEFYKVSKGAAPKNVDELAEGMLKGETGATQASIGRIRSGAYVVNFGADLSKGPDSVMAYEANAASRGGYLLAADGTISKVSASSLQSKLGK